MKTKLHILVFSEPIIDYISSEDLSPISEPESKINGLMDGLDSKDWTKVCESLNDVRRFSLFHSSILVPVLDKPHFVSGSVDFSISISNEIAECWYVGTRSKLDLDGMKEFGLGKLIQIGEDLLNDRLPEAREFG
ncbi:hypothetical protein MKX03_010986 [Papaver bracteatum]|nr:hypothetical protein MKX03_010986 [Papaver bracteatum]